MQKKVHKSDQICFTGPRFEEVLNDKVNSERLGRILNEFANGFQFLKKYELAASIFGSARCNAQDEAYKDAYDLAYGLSKEGFAVITGGGPGVMEAANRGAYDAGGQSVGLNIQLPTEQRTNPYVKDSESFHYFFTRKVMLAFASEVYIFFPGGFGTLDEFFEMVTLVQAEKIEPIPIILVNKEYWAPLLDWINKTLYEKNRSISKEDMSLYRVADDAKEALQLIKKMVV